MFSTIPVLSPAGIPMHATGMRIADTIMTRNAVDISGAEKKWGDF
jgi:hypothetical protein